MILNNIVKKSRFCEDELTELLRRIDPHIDSAQYYFKEDKEVVAVAYIDGYETVADVTGCNLRSMTIAILLSIGAEQ